jgi:hypothetical protein
LPAYNASAKNNIHELIKCPIYPDGIEYSLAFD